MEALKVFVLEAQENTLGIYFLEEMKIAVGYKTKVCKLFDYKIPLNILNC